MLLPENHIILPDEISFFLHGIANKFNIYFVNCIAEIVPVIPNFKLENVIRSHPHILSFVN